jgi:hypothetical protein
MLDKITLDKITEETALQVSEAEELPTLEPKAQQLETTGSQEDQAAYAYQKLLPLFYEEIEELSNKQLKKVVGAMMEYPLERIDFQWSYEKEKKAFIIGTKIMDCRFVIMKAVLDMKQEEIREMLKPKEDLPAPTVIVDQT